MRLSRHQEMGYDRTTSMFSPDGYLLQVEYAEKAVDLASPMIGAVCKDGIILVGDRRINSKFLVKDSVRKTFTIDQEICAGTTGFTSDGRIIIEKAQMLCQSHRVNYQNEMALISLVKEIANIYQYYSQAGGLRPFGASLIFGGFNDQEPTMYILSPSAVFNQYLVRAIGNNSEKLNEYLDEHYKEGQSFNATLKVLIKALETHFPELKLEKLDVATLNQKDGFTRINEKELKKIVG